MRHCSLGLVGLGFSVRDKVRDSVRDRAGVRVSNGVRVSTFYFRAVFHNLPEPWLLDVYVVTPGHLLC